MYTLAEVDDSFPTLVVLIYKVNKPSPIGTALCSVVLSFNLVEWKPHTHWPATMYIYIYTEIMMNMDIQNQAI